MSWGAVSVALVVLVLIGLPAWWNAVCSLWGMGLDHVRRRRHPVVMAIELALTLPLLPLYLFGGFSIAFAPVVLYIDLALRRARALQSLYDVPDWPLGRNFRGPGKNRPREFTEPMPWERGPCTSG